MLLEYSSMIPRTNVTSGFVDELTLFRNPSKLLQEIKREVVGEAPIELLQDKSILREFSAGYWGTERGTT